MYMLSVFGEFLAASDRIALVAAVDFPTLDVPNIAMFPDFEKSWV